MPPGSLRRIADAFTEALARLILRVFFREVEVVGLERVPRGGPLLVVANHVNSLVDPILVLGFLGARPRFLAKSTLFAHPVVAPLLLLAGALPVYRRGDAGEDVSRNLQTFARCRAALVERRAGGQRRLPSVAAGESTSLAGDAVLATASSAPGEGEDVGETATAGEPEPLPAAEPPSEGPSALLGAPSGAHGRRRPARYGLRIQFEERPEASELGRLVESTVWVNTSHPAYRRAVASRAEGYHIALSVAMALRLWRRSPPGGMPSSPRSSPRGERPSGATSAVGRPAAGEHEARGRRSPAQADRLLELRLRQRRSRRFRSPQGAFRRLQVRARKSPEGGRGGRQEVWR